MLPRIWLSLVLLAALPAWAQVQPAATGVSDTRDNGAGMMTPPPVSGQSYPTETLGETRSNYLRAGFTFDAGYDDNVLPGTTSASTGSMIYSIRPSFSFDRTTPRSHQTLSYAPGYTFYPNFTARNQVDQSASLDFLYRMSRHTTLTLNDRFQKSSNNFNQPFSPITGSPQPITEGTIPPIADHLDNAFDGEVTWQISRNAMLGGSGTATTLIYPNSSQVQNLYNSRSVQGSAFYNLRFARSQYAGATYLYARYITAPGATQSEVQTHTLDFFYTVYFTQTLSLSVTAGPQYYTDAIWPFPASGSWTPAVATSFAWQTDRANFTASYSRTVTGGGGLLGVYHSTTALASARLQVSRNWTVAPGAAYYLHNTVNGFSPSSTPQGHTVSGTFSINRTLGRHLTATFEYQHLNLAYTNVAALSANPDSNRESLSFTYTFERPIGQ